MKRIPFLALIFLMVFSFTACDRKTDVGSIQSSVPTRNEEVKEASTVSKSEKESFTEEKSSIANISSATGESFLEEDTSFSEASIKTESRSATAISSVVDVSSVAGDTTDIENPDEMTSSSATDTSRKTEQPKKSKKPKKKASLTPTQEKSNGIRPEFQKAMDEYVAFFEEYCAFLKVYSTSENPAALLAQYTQYMNQYATMLESFEAMDDKEMNTAELKLYIETNAKVQEMLLEAMAYT